MKMECVDNNGKKISHTHTHTHLVLVLVVNKTGANTKCLQSHCFNFKKSVLAFCCILL